MKAPMVKERKMDASNRATSVHLSPVVKQAVRTETRERNRAIDESEVFPKPRRWTMAATVEDILRKEFNLPRGGEG